MLELADSSDRAAVNALARQVLALHAAWRPDIYKMEDEPYPQALFLEHIRLRQFYVARIGGAILGYARIRICTCGGPGNVSRRVLMLEDLGVEESCRGQGLGSQIMEDVLALAKAFGCTDVQLSVQPQNEPALALYKKIRLHHPRPQSAPEDINRCPLRG